jgi:hypothetical protein
MFLDTKKVERIFKIVYILVYMCMGLRVSHNKSVLQDVIRRFENV